MRVYIVHVKTDIFTHLQPAPTTRTRAYGTYMIKNTIQGTDTISVFVFRLVPSLGGWNVRDRENELANFDVKIDNIGNADDARYE